MEHGVARIGVNRAGPAGAVLARGFDIALLTRRVRDGWNSDCEDRTRGANAHNMPAGKHSNASGPEPGREGRATLAFAAFSNGASGLGGRPAARGPP